MFDRLKQWNDRQGEKINDRVRAQADKAEAKGLPVVRIDGEPVDVWMRINAPRRIAKFGVLHLYPDRLVSMPNLGNVDAPVQVRPTAGVTATLDTAGGRSSRATLTRAVTVGGGWQKGTDDREAWLTVDSADGEQWVVPVSPDRQAAARQFATAVTNQGRHAAGV